MGKSLVSCFLRHTAHTASSKQREGLVIFKNLGSGASPNASALKYATEYTNYAVSQKKEDGDFYMVSLRRPTYQQAYVVCNFDCFIQTKRHINITGRHLHRQRQYLTKRCKRYVETSQINIK